MDAPVSTAQPLPRPLPALRVDAHGKRRVDCVP
jgi:hypothetical protein